ncbi:hypothetical protein I8748_17760 [Nostoc sp. CENA67]|uniref:Uncharacterized protein n=1 Tax=Amazonocrinis nigriterrae CENA67 TaxID=2794033 RepID=A0A8J7L939_9NOST|nr:hypothetical protein [Amazonocrinis nigriterrae]MBH8564008.1 hypothetical protein [Amazonocrinis nigriterrae CENA67]
MVHKNFRMYLTPDGQKDKVFYYSGSYSKVGRVISAFILPYPSLQEHLKQDLTLAIRESECPECKSFWDRDINATLNLMLFSESKIPLEEGKSTPEQPVERLGITRSSG